MIIALLATIALIITLLWLFDFGVNIPNRLAIVLHPKDLQHVTIDPNRPPAPSPTYYLPPNLPCLENPDAIPQLPRLEQATPNPDDKNSVLLMISGSPGVAELYFNYLQLLNRKFPHIHLYTVGHSQHSPLVNDDQMRKYVTEQVKKGNFYQKNSIFYTILNAIGPLLCGYHKPQYDDELYPAECNTVLPPMDTQNIIVKSRTDRDMVKKCFNGNISPEECEKVIAHYNIDRNAFNLGIEPLVLDDEYTLRDVVAQKIATLAKLRARHPHSEFVLQAHSMGNWCTIELLRALDRMYILQHFGESYLNQYDSMTETLVSDCENSDILINLPSFSKSLGVKNTVYKYLYTPTELKLWTDALINTPPPPQEIIDFVTQHQSLPDLKTLQQSGIFSSATEYIKCWHGLMPVHSRISEQSQGWYLTTLYRSPFLQANLLPVMEWFLTKLPSPLKRALIGLHTLPWRYPHVNIAMKLVCNQVAINTTHHMSNDEIDQIRTFDVKLIARHHQHKILYIMNRTDGWANGWTQDYYRNVSKYLYKQNTVQPLHAANDQAFPVIDETDAPHAFIFGYDQKIINYSVAHINTVSPSFFDVKSNILFKAKVD